jgi:NADH-quinone oxidoreductase subunit B
VASHTQQLGQVITPPARGVLDAGTGLPASDAHLAAFNRRLADRGFLVITSDNLIKWVRTGWLMWMTFGLACCTVEMMHDATI